MDLKDFIVSAITDISLAVSEADKAVKSAGGLVNPGGHTTPPTDGQSTKFVAPRTTLNFDIAVSASSTKSTDAETKAKIWVVEASLGGEAVSKNETVSRLTFTIDVVLPHDKEQNKRVGLVKGGQ